MRECLRCITEQVGKNDERIEILVSDNCSPDNTPEVVGEYINAGHQIRYIVNSVNMGLDFNVAQCFREAAGQFVLAFGDDDQLLDGSVDLILKAIQENRDCGVISLNTHDHNHAEAGISVFNNRLEFIHQVHFFVTFISSNVINKSFIDFDNLLKYQPTLLNHTNLVLEALLQAPKNVFIRHKSVVGAGIQNSQCNAYQVFGHTLNRIMADTEEKYNIAGMRNAINNQLLLHFFPTIIIIHKRAARPFEPGKIHRTLYPVFRRYAFYWILCFPILFSPGTTIDQNTCNKMKIVIFKLLKVKGYLNNVFATHGPN